MPVFEIEIISQQTGRVYVEAESLEDVEAAWNYCEIESECMEWDIERVHDTMFSEVTTPKPNQAKFGVHGEDFVEIEEYHAKHAPAEVPAFFEDKHTIAMPL